MRALVLSAIPVGVVIILLTPSLIGQHYFTSACIAQAQGAKEKAITFYRRAMWFDRWHAEDVNTYAAIGDLESCRSSSKDSPEKHISKAREFKEATQYDLAIFELARAAEWGGAQHQSRDVSRHVPAWSLASRSTVAEVLVQL